MKTEHRIIFSDSRDMSILKDESVDLILTSPPYPMIEMWDSVFKDMNPRIGSVLNKGRGLNAYELMHKELDIVWKDCFRVLKNGGFACINIGDATRTISENFCLYPNHSRVIQGMIKLGFTALTSVLWRKPTNAPTKFMGSGMLPAGAYVTLEHEYILIFRKGSKRQFNNDKEKSLRKESAMFWEERNLWFSDIWTDIKGASQKLKNGDSRKRSAAFPFEIAYRLINMYSVKNDVVLDPFLGTGTTTLASMVAARNSFGFEIDGTLKETIDDSFSSIIKKGSEIIEARLDNHRKFVEKRAGGKGKLKHINDFYSFPVVTAQERELLLSRPFALEKKGDRIVLSYE